MRRDAATDHDVHPLLRGRHSPRAFTDAAVSPATLRGILEAARWAPSCFNDQPWAFIVAPREDEATFAALLGCLTPFNQAWAGSAPVLLLTVARTHFRHNQTPNRHAWHDVGLATAQITLEAQARGLAAHVMAGFDIEAATAAFQLPDGYEPVAAIALGHQRETLDGLAPEVAERERAARQRRPQADFVWGAGFEQPLRLAGEAPWTPVLDFWFGDLDDRGEAHPAKEAEWFGKSPAFDAEILRRFKGLYEELARGEHADWLEDPRGRLATVVVLDQLSRNMFRGDAQMYAADERALALALEGLARGDDRSLQLAERVFLYMPLMHAEDVGHQERCVALMTALRASAPASLREKYALHVKFAGLHRDVVARFGHFPHRNDILGRPTTPEEAVFLQGPNSSF